MEEQYSSLLEYGSEEDRVYETPEQKEASIQQKLQQERDDLANDILTTFSTRAGKRTLKWIMDYAGYRKPAFSSATQMKPNGGINDMRNFLDGMKQIPFQVELAIEKAREGKQGKNKKPKIRKDY